MTSMTESTRERHKYIDGMCSINGFQNRIEIQYINEKDPLEFSNAEHISPTWRPVDEVKAIKDALRDYFSFDN